MRKISIKKSIAFVSALAMTATISMSAMSAMSANAAGLNVSSYCLTFTDYYGNSYIFNDYDVNTKEFMSIKIESPNEDVDVTAEDWCYEWYPEATQCDATVKTIDENNISYSFTFSDDDGNVVRSESGSGSLNCFTEYGCYVVPAGSQIETYLSATLGWNVVAEEDFDEVIEEENLDFLAYCGGLRNDITEDDVNDYLANAKSAEDTTTSVANLNVNSYSLSVTDYYGNSYYFDRYDVDTKEFMSVKIESLAENEDDWEQERWYKWYPGTTQCEATVNSIDEENISCSYTFTDDNGNVTHSANSCASLNCYTLLGSFVVPSGSQIETYLSDTLGWSVVTEEDFDEVIEERNLDLLAYCGGLRNDITEDEINDYLANAKPTEDVESTDATTEEATTVGTTEEVTVYGDLNGDGETTIGDAVLLDKYLVGNAELANEANADVNLDGEVDATDATIIIGYNVSKIASLPYTE